MAGCVTLSHISCFLTFPPPSPASQFDKLEELIYIESHLSNTSAKFYGEITQQMLKNSSFPGSTNGTGLFQTIAGLKVRGWPGCSGSSACWGGQYSTWGRARGGAGRDGGEVGGAQSQLCWCWARSAARVAAGSAPVSGVHPSAVGGEGSYPFRHPHPDWEM